MPIREYECQACGTRFEEMQRITDSTLPMCSKCHSDHVRRLVSQTTFILKGSGWYATDYAHKGGNGNGSSKKKEDAGHDAPAVTDGKTGTTADPLRAAERPSSPGSPGDTRVPGNKDSGPPKSNTTTA